MYCAGDVRQLTNCASHHVGAISLYVREHCVDEVLSSKAQADQNLCAVAADSPAICPIGWTIAATFLSSFLFTPHGPVQTAYNLPLGSDTSAALCCPSYVSR
jgi:hypothetical protein